MKNTIFVIVAMSALTINHILVASQYTPNDSDAYEYYDDLDDFGTTTEYATEPPTTSTTTTTTTTTVRPFINRRTSRPTVQFYNKPFRFSNQFNGNQVNNNNNQFQPIETTYQQPLQTTQLPTQRPRTRATSSSTVGINRNAIIDLDRSENRKDYAQSRIADDTEEDEKFLSRRYARFLFMRRVG